MAEQVVDCSDGVNEIVFDKDNIERKSWKFCNSISLPRSEVVFFSQLFIIFIIISVSIIKLCFYEVDCDEMPVWVMLLSSSVGYILPNPKI